MAFKDQNNTRVLNIIAAAGMQLEDVFTQPDAIKRLDGIGRSQFARLRRLALAQVPKAKCLWLSRHEPTAEQRLELGDDVVIINATFAAEARTAAEEVLALATNTGAKVISGVFPAHVAVELIARNLRQDGVGDCSWKPAGFTLLLPVSVPVAASDGQVRGFKHSHFERYCV